MELAQPKVDRVRVADKERYEIANTGVNTGSFSSYKFDHTVVHPVQKIQHMHDMNERKVHNQMLALTYGAHYPMRLEFERQIVSQFHRLPCQGLKSEHLALDLLNGTDEKFGFEDYLNLPSEAPEDVNNNATLHTLMERKMESSSVPRK
eukprot:CAMPEP_0184692656 /NCGR_PEP_ID=MMETSP0313-20130426/1042_1 /TAXON_ID=2792 /ORGANISM="Porphyridium aerugineum, Strain SAG 1380-2" /LENGTH=148 /DNA_ID=CAMNT_0027150499 /DNA_START=100 /DNA_END=546 /DNA_ORIENTATION=-